jgi:aminoglycoside phosphotransferase (APT) family kinase protein
VDRRRPIAESELDRIARAVDPQARVWRSSPLLGGLDWGTYALELNTPAGPRSLVLRRHDGSGERPAAAAKRLWAALNALQAVDLPVPRPVLFDEGSLLGAPIVVMSRCPGAVRPPPADPVAWLEGYAGIVAAIQDVDVETLAGLPRCPDRQGELDRLVEHSRQGRTGSEWEEAVARLRAHVDDLADATPVLRHRDLWFGNTLWTADRITGVVDWSGACVGDPRGDVGYARVDVHLVLGTNAARLFHSAIERRRGPMPDTAWWELLAAVDGLAWLLEWVEGYQEVGSDLTVALARARLREFMADARSRL